MQSLAATKADKVIDACCCCYPLLEARKGILEVPVGGVLEIDSTDSCCKNDVLTWAKKTGHEFLGVVADPRYDRIFVRRLK